ncbi:MAG TPA: T9SS type A sorting domain-containing protein [Candidatus Kapabacteria bacterium]|jgi:hypothetical protein|nr:T9SS type A sorting domain-containing protein [Candidatus Kapabacteria bacterium]
MLSWIAAASLQHYELHVVFRGNRMYLYSGTPAWDQLDARILLFHSLLQSMRRNRLLEYSLLLACLIFASGARAQYRWHVTHPSYDNHGHSFKFTSLDCWGEVCIAGGIKTDTSLKTVQASAIIFYRSTDGGQTWAEQDPNLPHERIIGNQIEAVQQIDSLDAVGVGDSGLVLRTSDGGATWEKQDLHTSEYVSNVHFSDLMTGIVILARATTGVVSACDIATTHDGGKNWSLAPFSPWLFASDCHSDGDGKFRVISDDIGPVYKTSDNWATVDSTPLIIPWADSIHVLGHFNFKGEDTIVGYGASVYGTIGLVPVYVFITHSINGGMSWDSVALSVSGSDGIESMSSLDRNIVFGAESGSGTRMEVSTDHGITWRVDSLILDTTGYRPYFIQSIAVTSQGYGVFISSLGDQGLIFRGDPPSEHVESNKHIVDDGHIYPNPATTNLTITSSIGASSVYLYDILGREALSGTLLNGHATLDVSHLPRGIYSVVLEHNGRLIPAGKIAVVENK